LPPLTGTTLLIGTIALSPNIGCLILFRVMQGVHAIGR
jgi:hypothetical protein